MGQEYGPSLPPLSGNTCNYCLGPHGKESTIQVTYSNLDFSDWGTLFASPGTAAALLDRLLHHAHVITLRGDSYRVRNRLVPPKLTQAKEG
ncbi:ATP-binding protein [Desulforudis sp. 1088]|uniref:ATP-binding protein n=1 Tax=unclassified Candidatus Desulforudis TaxID=2635950 RepID=UPI003CE4F13E